MVEEIFQIDTFSAVLPIRKDARPLGIARIVVCTSS
jgi:hypothetical protein